MHHNSTYTSAKEKLLNINSKIKSLMPDITELIKIDRVGISEVKEGFLDGESIERVIIILRSSGCEWALKEDGGCLMCGHYCGTTKGKRISLESFIQQIDTEMALYDFTKYPMLCVYNSGSLLNEKEMPIEARKYLFDKISKTAGIRRLIIESRPEYITTEVLDEIDNRLPNILVEIGVGLETHNGEIRDLCLNKGIKTDEYALLAERMKKYKSKLLGYVLIKPPFLTEMYAIEDSIRTVEYAFEIGFDIVSLEPVSVQDFTIIDYLHEAAQYRSPWIWSVLEVIKKTYNKGFIRIGGFEFFPIPKTFTHNCDKCNLSSIEKIKEFNRTYDINVFSSLCCDCQQQWQFDLQEKMLQIPEKINNILDSINEDYILEKMKNKYDTRGDVNERKNELLYKSCSTQNL